MKNKLLVMAFLVTASLSGMEGHVMPESNRGVSRSVESKLKTPPQSQQKSQGSWFKNLFGRGGKPEQLTTPSTQDEGWQNVSMSDVPSNNQIASEHEWEWEHVPKKGDYNDSSSPVKQFDQISQSSGVYSGTSSLNGSFSEQPVENHIQGVNDVLPVENRIQSVNDVLSVTPVTAKQKEELIDKSRIAEKPSKEAIDNILVDLHEFSKKLSTGAITSEAYKQKVEDIKKQFESNKSILKLIDHESSHIINGLELRNLAFFSGDMIKNPQEFAAWLNEAVSEKRLIEVTKQTIQSLEPVVKKMEDFSKYLELLGLATKSSGDLQTLNKIKGTFEGKDPLVILKDLEASYAQAEEPLKQLEGERSFVQVVATSKEYPLATDALDQIRLRAVVSLLNPETFNEREKIDFIRKMLAINQDGSAGTPLLLLEHVRRLKEQINPIKDDIVRELLDNLVVNSAGIVVDQAGKKITNEQLEAIFNEWLPSFKKNRNHTFLETVTYADPQILGLLAKVKEDGFDQKDKNKQLYRDLSLQLGNVLNRDYFVKTKLMNVSSTLVPADSGRLLNAVIGQNGDLADKSALLEQESSFKSNFNKAWKLYQSNVKPF